MARITYGGAAARRFGMLGDERPATDSSRPRLASGRTIDSLARRMNGDRGRVLQFRDAFHASQVPMVLVDNRRRYLDANLAARLLFRLSLAELRVRQIDDLTPPADLPRMELLWAQLVSAGEVCGDYDVRFDDMSRIRIAFSALANVFPGQHLIVFAPARWPDEELGELEASPSVIPSPGPLSAREREVLMLIAQGKSLPEIADLLTISPATVRTHAGNVYRKLGARNRPHAVALALELGFIGQPDRRR
jgi:DNA-binding CsgD family transcriptional regulator